jgi:hypothetical protein
MLLAIAITVAISIGGVFLILCIPPERPAVTTSPLPRQLGFVHAGTEALMIGNPVEVAIPRADSSGVYDYLRLSELQQLVKERKGR